jgi:hypothetical protein
VFGLKHFPSTFSLNAIRRASSLDHRYIATWWREHFLIDSLLLWFDEVLDCGGLMAIVAFVVVVMVYVACCYHISCINVFITASGPFLSHPT